MVDKLRAIIEQAEKLSDAEQEALAEVWEQQLVDAQWDATLESPESLATLDKLVARAKEQVALYPPMEAEELLLRLGFDDAETQTGRKEAEDQLR